MFDTFSDASSVVDSLPFNRFYNSTDTSNVSSDVSNGWRHSFSRNVAIKYSTIEVTSLSPAGASSQYADPATACTSGFAEIKSKVPQWAGALSSFSNGNCVLTKNGAYVGTVVVHSTGGSLAPAPTPVAYDVIRDDGQLIRFIINNGSIIAPVGIGLKLQQTASGFTVTDNNDNVEQYDTNGKLLSITSRAGVVQTMTYDASGRLSSVNDTFGHQLTFSYDTQGHLNMVTKQ